MRYTVAALVPFLASAFRARLCATARGGESLHRRGSVMRCRRHEQRSDGRVHRVCGRPTDPCAPPARHLHARAPPGSLGGSADSRSCMCPNSGVFFFIGEKSTQSGNLTWRSFFSCTEPQATDPAGGSEDLTPATLSSVAQSGPFFPFLRAAGWREQGSGPTPAQHQGRRRSVRWTECVTFPFGQGGACQASFLT